LIIVGVLCGMAAIRVGVVLSGTPMLSAIWMEFPLHMMALGSIGLLFKKRLVLVGAPFLVATILGARDPANASLYLAICHVVAFSFVAWLWRPSGNATP
jgi:hypothetical protein